MCWMLAQNEQMGIPTSFSTPGKPLECICIGTYIRTFLSHTDVLQKYSFNMRFFFFALSYSPATEETQSILHQDFK